MRKAFKIANKKIKVDNQVDFSSLGQNINTSYVNRFKSDELNLLMDEYSNIRNSEAFYTPKGLDRMANIQTRISKIIDDIDNLNKEKKEKERADIEVQRLEAQRLKEIEAENQRLERERIQKETEEEELRNTQRDDYDPDDPYNLYK